MNKIIIYGSYYGSTKRYAEKLSQLTSIPVTNYKKVKDLSKYETIIYLGGLYAGGVVGLKRTIKYIPKNANLSIITVGIADVSKQQNTNNIKKSVEKQISNTFYKQLNIFHLRGDLDYKKLNLKHRLMMKALYTSLKNKPNDKLTDEDKSIISTYNQSISFTDLSALEPIIKNLY